MAKKKKASDLSRKPSAAQFVPDRITLPSMRSAVQKCKGCDLYRNATHAVFGEGPRRARFMFIGEQPGSQEDLEGHPFVGPAGKILDEALQRAGIDRREVYVTNAVKHFKWKASGKRRIHSKPSAGEIRACFDWLANEIRIVKPEVIVCLGATAAFAIFNQQVAIFASRGRWFKTQWCEKTMVTVHPSSILRVPSSEERERAKSDFVQDLKFAQRGLGK